MKKDVRAVMSGILIHVGVFVPLATVLISQDDFWAMISIALGAILFGAGLGGLFSD